jgi:TonB family protein
MIKAISALIVALLLSATVLGASPEPHLKSVPMPFYPPLAREARIEGKVSIRFTVNEQGDTSEVEAVTGNQMLRQSAIENVQSWKYIWSGPCPCREEKEATFVYKLSGRLESQDRPNVTVKWFGKSGVVRVEIEADNPHWEP